MQIQLSLQPRAHVAALPRPSVVTILKCKLNLLQSCVLCAFSRQLLQIEARNCGNRDPYCGPNGSHLPLMNSCAFELLHFPTT